MKLRRDQHVFLGWVKMPKPVAGHTHRYPMVLDVPVEEMLTPSSISRSPPTSGWTSKSGNVTSLLLDLASMDKEWVFEREGEIRRITVPTAWRVPEIDCFLEDGWLTNSFGVLGTVATWTSGGRPGEANWGPSLEAPSVSILGNRLTWNNDVYLPIKMFLFKVWKLLTSFLVFLNLKVFLLWAFCLWSLELFSWNAGISWSPTVEVTVPVVVVPLDTELGAASGAPGSLNTTIKKT